jgi:hypothetical protein
MLPNPAAMFLRRNPDIVNTLASYLNKQQVLHADVMTLMTGVQTTFPPLNAERILAAVDKQGPEILQRVILAMDKQMDAVFKSITDAVLAEQARVAAEQKPAEPEPRSEPEAFVVPVEE